MRILTITLFVLLILLALILLVPVAFLELTDTVQKSTGVVMPEDLKQNIGMSLAEVATSSGRPTTAVAVYDYFIATHNEQSDLYVLKCDALLAAGDDAGAMEALDQALSWDPLNPQFLIKKARLLVKAGKKSEADSIFDSILAIQTDNPKYLSTIADIALERTRYLEAFDRYSRLANLTPKDGRIWEKRSDVIFALLTIPTAGINASPSLKQTDLYTDGIKGYEQAIILRPDQEKNIRSKMYKRSDEYVARSIQELEDRYREFKYLQPGADPIRSILG
ncbi:MAG: tetratricopeptide repeat protein [Methanospirillum sp.]|uniref:tetratricopeptide repeat protein n=1 Tax=Methanospirillum sp. TaxID=45200 RepID=UPI002369D124|nr:tetratricopeptide repeat protein [Methanospirillum sp.]MDD1729909.1 tetratricopeptide repeat protein [Methanospirillum sp.]